MLRRCQLPFRAFLKVLRAFFRCRHKPSPLHHFGSGRNPSPTQTCAAMLALAKTLSLYSSIDCCVCFQPCHVQLDSHTHFLESFKLPLGNCTSAPWGEVWLGGIFSPVYSGLVVRSSQHTSPSVVVVLQPSPINPPHPRGSMFSPIPLVARSALAPLLLSFSPLPSV